MLIRAFPPAVLAALVLASPAVAGVNEDTRAALGAIADAESAGRISREDGARYALIARRAQEVLRLLPGARAKNLAAVLRQVAVQSARANAPRSLALFSMLEANADYLAVEPMPVSGAYVRDGAGIVYRAVPERGLQFHPLRSFARLNAELGAGHADAAAVLAAELLARGVPSRGSLVWEYYFPFGDGEPPWTSGMAQSVAAQALARAGTAIGDDAFLAGARRAYRAVPGRLLLHLPAGPWIRHYSFNDLVVLNAQLQAAISLETYASLAGDFSAARLARRLQSTSAVMLSRFDTGYWSRYALRGESPLGYHVYVVSLLRKLAARTGSPLWADAAARFDRYTHERPRLELRSYVRTLYPRPADGFHDRAKLRFWLSKPATVTFRVGGARRARWFGGGTHTVRWSPSDTIPRAYSASLEAVDPAGNRGRLRLREVVVRVDRRAPTVEASVEGRRLVWHAVDRATPWIRLHLRLVRAGRSVLQKLGRHGLDGSLRLELPPGPWRARLLAYDSSGNRARIPLGRLPAG